jgi:hypothetical protein
VTTLRHAPLVVCAALFLTACPPNNGVGGSTTSSSATTIPATTTTTMATAARLCAGSAAQQIGTVADPALTEVSGLVQSREHDGVLWVHNDSGDTARVFAIDHDGATLRQYALGGASAIDWEDIAIVPGANGAADSLYLGDIGDNAKARSDITIYAIDEPDPATDTGTPTARSQRLVYPDGAHDAEAMFVDPASRDLFIVTKELSGASGVYRKAGGLLSAEPTLTKVATLDLGVGQLVTAGDIAADGSVIVLRTYGAVFAWDRQVGEDISDAFGRDPCQPPVPNERQGEAIGLDPDGNGFITTSEGTNQPISHVAAG